MASTSSVTSSASNNVNTSRVTGLVSGFDTDTMVEDLMNIEQLKLDKLNKERITAEWKEEALRDVNKTIKTFRDKFMSVLSSDNMYTSSVYKAYKVDVEATTAFGISANNEAVSGEHTINSITSLAKAATTESASGVSGGVGIKPGQTLEEFALTQNLQFNSNNQINFKINDVEFTFNKTDTLNKMLTTVNSSTANVTMSYSSLSDKFTISTKATGTTASLAIVNGVDGGNAFGTNSAFGIEETTKNGTDAKVNIDGYDVVKTENSFTIDGITYNLKAQTTAPVKFNVTQDVASVVSKIKSFVTAYNDLVGSLNEVVGEEKDYDYSPLTDKQKEDMEDEEIEKWEGKAKSGILRNDASINHLLSELRASIYTKVPGSNISLSDIGITTGTYAEKGKLVINEEKLNAAITKRPDDVATLFVATSTSTDKTVKYNESGFIPRMVMSYTSYNGKVDFNKIDENINSYKNKIDEFEDLMAEKEESYYQQFSAMETALAKMASQSSWLSQQFG